MNRLYLVLTSDDGLEQAVFVDIKDKKAEHLKRTMKFGKKMYYDDYIKLQVSIEQDLNKLGV